MAETFQFSLVSPEREVVSDAVEHVIVPGVNGDFGVLPRHAPFMTTLRAGALVILKENAARKIFVRGGFADVTPEGLTVLAEDAASLDDVSPSDLDEQLQAARARLADADEATRPAAEAEVERLQAMVQALAQAAYV